MCGAGALAIVALGLVVHVPVQPPGIPLEYRVKAVYLFNFVKYVEWPSRNATGPLMICVAEHNPFGDALSEAVRGELVNNRVVETRIITNPDQACHVMFVPRTVGSAPFLAASRGAPTLTVGETPGFIKQGGLVNFILEEGKVRFVIDSKAAEHADLRISSHLLRLARPPEAKRQS